MTPGFSLLRSCSWCHATNPVTGRRVLCRTCGHRADLPRAACDCAVCQPATLPLASASPRCRLPFATTRHELALALFYEAPVRTAGNGTLSEAEEQAALMLGAGKLYDACAALVALLDREARQRIFDRELIAVAELARAALQEADLTQA